MANATRGADVAQLVEQLIRNEQVTGSIPAIGSIKIARPSGLVIFMGLNGGASRRFAPSTKCEVPPPCQMSHFYDYLRDSRFNKSFDNDIVFLEILISSPLSAT